MCSVAALLCRSGDLSTSAMARLLFNGSEKQERRTSNDMFGLLVKTKEAERMHDINNRECGLNFTRLPIIPMIIKQYASLSDSHEKLVWGV